MNGLSTNTMRWVIATFTVALLPQLIRMPPIVAVFALAPLAWRLAADAQNWPQLPSWIRHGLTALALASLFFSYGNLSGRRAAVSLLAVMLAMKLIECYRIRDARLIVSFSLFLCATQFLFVQKIIMPFYGAVVVLLAMAALVHLQRAETWLHSGEQPPKIRASVASELGFSVRLLALAIPTGLVFFLLFPRLSSPLWGIPETTLDSKSGLSDSMTPGSIQELFMDDSPAFRIKFDGPVPPPSERYWRGPVFWDFDGQTWRDSFYSRHLEAAALPDDSGAGVYRYTVQLEPNERKSLFALDYPTASPQNSTIMMDFRIVRRDPVLQLFEYEMVSNPDFRDQPESLAYELRLTALDLPEDFNPRTRRLIENWREEGLPDRDIVARAYRYFSRDPFRYTLNPPLLGRHTVDEFLFDSQAGFCEHYASSFAVMMRMAGIPARIVTGYMGGFYNEAGEYMLVRQSDAHAWAEVWLQGEGWVAVDPTAAVSPSRIERGSLSAVEGPRFMLDFPWLRDMKNSVDIVQQRWNDWVIEYGARRQAELFAGLGLKSMTPGTLILVLVLALSVSTAIVVPIVLRIRGPAEKDPARRAWMKFLKLLEKSGFKASLALGPMEVAHEASLALPEHRDIIGRIAALYSRCRYSPSPPPVSQLERAVGIFKSKKSRIR